VARSTARARGRRRAKARPHALSAERAAALRPALERLVARTDASARIGYDPVEIPRRYAAGRDAEVAGLLAASLAYGRADLFKPQLERVLAAMGPSPARFAESFSRAPDAEAFAGFHYRFNRREDVAALVAAIGHVRVQHGSLGDRFAALFAASSAAPDPLRAALAAFADELRSAPPVAPLLAERGRRGLLHLLPDPRLAGACKRWNLYLRWMVRGPDAVDLGLWRGVPRRALVIPLDTHVHRIARQLGLTARNDATWRTAAEVTASLRAIDPEDPVRFDFALCHLGMSGACPARRDPHRCELCDLARSCAARGATLRRRAVSGSAAVAPRGSGSGRARRS
jgi:uncharacterized protein (TIGR02757 family)